MQAKTNKVGAKKRSPANTKLYVTKKAFCNNYFDNGWSTCYSLTGTINRRSN